MTTDYFWYGYADRKNKIVANPNNAGANTPKSYSEYMNGYNLAISQEETHQEWEGLLRKISETKPSNEDILKMIGDFTKK